jgi:hypothetical protein
MELRCYRMGVFFSLKPNKDSNTFINYNHKLSEFKPAQFYKQPLI